MDNHSTWILITVLMVMQSTAGASFVKSLLRIVGTVAAAFTSILLFGLFSQDPALLMAGFFGVQAVAAYGFSGSRFQYAWFVWAFTTAIVLGDSMAGQGAVETVAFQRASMVAIGVVLVFIVDSFAKTHSESRLRESLATRALEIGERLRLAIRDSVRDSVEEREPLKRDVGPSALGAQLALIAVVRVEIDVSRRTANSLSHLAIQLETVASLVRSLSASIESPAESDAALADAQVELAERVESALREVAAAVGAGREPPRFSDGLERAMLALEAERDRSAGRRSLSASLEGRLSTLRGVVAVVSELESTECSTEKLPRVGPGRSFLEIRPDPLRMKIALRTGIAVVLAFVVPLSLGWPMNTLVAPTAFMVAAARTRGALSNLVVSLAAVVALGWLVADLAIVYLMPHLGRAPIALVMPFAVGVLFVAIAALHPLLAPLPALGGLVALLSVFGGTSTPTDVYGAYSTVCYLALAVAVAALCQRSLWPVTTAALFREHVGAQLELCLDALREETGESGATERAQRTADLLRAYAQQSAALASLHNDAAREPVEHALDPALRAEVLALTTDLVDAVLGYHRSGVEGRSGESFRDLLEAVQYEKAALLESMQASVGIMRDGAARLDSNLASAHRAVEERANSLQADPSRFSALSSEEARRFLVELDSRRKLVLCQRALEDWFAKWDRADEAIA